MTNSVIWICLGSVANIVKDYFQVNYISINWLALVYSVLAPFVVLAAYVLNKYGLKVVIVAGACSNHLATYLKFIGHKRNGYIFQLIGNIFAAFGNCLLYFIPPTLAATWFGEKERARATAIGTLMNMSGTAVGFLMGSLLIPASKDYEGAVKHGMFVTLLSLAVFSTILLIVAIIFVQRAPAIPPTKTQSISRMRKHIKQEFHTGAISIESEGGIENNTFQSDEPENAIQDASNEMERNEIPPGSVGRFTDIHSTGLLQNLKFLIRMLPFHLLLHSYGIYFGIGAAVFSTLNQMCIKHFPSNEKLIGIMGFTNILCGMLSTLLCGIFIDKTHRYKTISIAIFVACAISFITFTVSFKYSGSFALTFVCFSIYGLCSSPFLTVGLEYMVEITYPVKESNLSFILFISGCSYSFVLTYIFVSIIEKFGSDIAGYTVAGIYIVGMILITLVRSELKRIKIDSGGTITQEPQHDANGPGLN